VLAAEHKLYPLALALIADGRVRVEGERAIIDGDRPRVGGPLFSPAEAG